jgi:hypothetical protein
VKVTHPVNDVFTTDYVVDSKTNQDGGALGPVVMQISCENKAFLIALQTLMGTDTHKMTLNQDGNLVIEDVLSISTGESRTQSADTYIRQ